MTRQLLMEGAQPFLTAQYVTESGAVLVRNDADGALVTESKERLWFNAEKNKFLNEAGEEREVNIKSIRGVFQRADTPNANKRIYPRGLWEKLLGEGSEVVSRMKAGGMSGHMEHPKDGITDLNIIAIRVSDLRLEKDGAVVGEAVLLNTAKGRDAQALVNGGVRVGISSRGRGTVGSDGRVQEDFVLETFDLVHNPSTPGAYPTEVAESASVKPAQVAQTQKPAIIAPITAQESHIMATNVRTLEETARPLLKQDPTALSFTERAGLYDRLTALMEDSAKAIGVNPGEAPLIAPLILDLRQQRTKVAEAGMTEADELKKQLSEATASLTEATKKLEETEAKLVVESKNHEAAVKLAEALVQEFTQRVSELSDTSEATDELKASLGKAHKTIAKLQTECADTSKRLESANKILAARKDGTKTVKESVDELIAKHPILGEAKKQLTECTSVEALNALAESLIKVAKKSGSADTLRPHGLVIESNGRNDSSTVVTESKEGKSKGALIGEAIANMSPSLFR